MGLEAAGFSHRIAVELDKFAIQTLELNRPSWHPVLANIRDYALSSYRGVDLFAGGVPCPPFSIAGKQLGESDERDLFPAALARIEEAQPRAVLLENVPGFAKAKFADYRDRIEASLRSLGFSFVEGRVLQASDFGVCQLRPRFVLVALRGPAANRFEWPQLRASDRSVGDLLYDLMSARGWKGAARWAKGANRIAPTLVGGSKLHGGPDLGPSRAKAAWRQLGVDGGGIADFAPDASCPANQPPKLTLRMTARLQGFPDHWQFAGGKTAAYRQVGNAFPPPVAEAIGGAIRNALLGAVKRGTEPLGKRRAS